MKRVVAEEAGLRVIEVDEPLPEPGEVLVEMRVSGVCGSDLHAVAGRHPFVPLPYFPGHEVVGRIAALGADVTGVAVGDRVTVEPTLPCGACKMCRTERENLCEALQFFGCGYRQGGMAESFTVPAGRVRVLPDGMSELDAALIEPLATPVHAVSLAGGVRGKAVVIMGAGTIGMLVLAAARADGARTVIMTDPLAAKRERALELGADAVFDAARPDLVSVVREQLGESADVVFDCVALETTVGQGVELATKGGIVMVVGVPTRAVTVPLPQMQDYQVRVQGSATYTASDFARAIEIIHSGGVRAADMITATYPLDQVAEAFAAARSGEHGKVVLAAGALD